MEAITKGLKYFKYDKENNDLEVIRIMNCKDPKSFKISIETGTSDKKEISKEDLLKDYVKLNPDAIIFFNIVKIQHLEDVIVTVFRKEELENDPTGKPYSVCRQNITDFFANSLAKDMNFCGVNVTKDTLPEGVDMMNMMSCDSIESYESMAFYLSDTLNTILSFIKTRTYDNVLYTLFMDHLRFKSNSGSGSSRLYMETMKNKKHVDGYCKSITSLLIHNNFMFDLLRGFNVYPMDIDLTKDNKVGCLLYENRKIIERMICANIPNGMDGSIVIPYEKDIDLDSVEQLHILISDLKDNLYLIAYKTYGKYHIPVEQVESEENIELLAKSINFSEGSSITEAYEHIMFNKDKYK